MKRIVWTTLVLTMAVATVAAVEARRPADDSRRGAFGMRGSCPMGDCEPGMGHGDRRMPERLARTLDLTDEQRESWMALHDEHAERMEPLRADVARLQEELGRLLEQADPNPADVGLAAIALHGARDEIGGARAELEEALIGTLDEEQRVRFETMKSLRGGHGERGKRRRMRGHGDHGFADGGR